MMPKAKKRSKKEVFTGYLCFSVHEGIRFFHILKRANEFVKDNDNFSYPFKIQYEYLDE